MVSGFRVFVTFVDRRIVDDRSELRKSSEMNSWKLEFACMLLACLFYTIGRFLFLLSDEYFLNGAIYFEQRIIYIQAT